MKLGYIGYLRTAIFIQYIRNLLYLYTWGFLLFCTIGTETFIRLSDTTIPIHISEFYFFQYPTVRYCKRVLHIITLFCPVLSLGFTKWQIPDWFGKRVLSKSKNFVQRKKLAFIPMSLISDPNPVIPSPPLALLNRDQSPVFVWHSAIHPPGKTRYNGSAPTT